MQVYGTDKTDVAFYRYDVGGERDLKLAGTVYNTSNNGRPALVPVYEKSVLYASNLMTIERRGIVKHYFAESERILANVFTGGMPLVPTNTILKPVNKINGGDAYEISKKFTIFAA
jgi:hypothetical protein